MVVISCYLAKLIVKKSGIKHREDLDDSEGCLYKHMIIMVVFPIMFSIMDFVLLVGAVVLSHTY